MRLLSRKLLSAKLTNPLKETEGYLYLNPLQAIIHLSSPLLHLSHISLTHIIMPSPCHILASPWHLTAPEPIPRSSSPGRAAEQTETAAHWPRPPTQKAKAGCCCCCAAMLPKEKPPPDTLGARFSSSSSSSPKCASRISTA